MKRIFIIIGCVLALLNCVIACAYDDIDQAWEALNRKEYVKARKFAGKCVKKAKDEAKQQQQELDSRKESSGDMIQAVRYGSLCPIRDRDLPGMDKVKNNKELNDIATACFIEAEILAREKKTSEAKQRYKEIIDEYQDGYCWDPKGWYWKVSDVAQDRIDTLETKYDYGDYRSETLSQKAWQSLKERDLKGIEMYAGKCIYLFEREAKKMSTKIQTSAKKGQESVNWALNDVATCYFILGERYLVEKKDALARQMYGEAARLGFAVCWDPKGWYWNVADTAKDKIRTSGTKYNYEDYRSVTLTTKAWRSLNEDDYEGIELYAKKCIYLYENEAKQMRSQMNGYAQRNFIPYHWALNNVGTCYFILGEAYRKQGNLQQAEEAYRAVINNYSYAQCWDPRGWYWKVAEVCQKRLRGLR